MGTYDGGDLSCVGSSEVGWVGVKSGGVELEMLGCVVSFEV